MGSMRVALRAGIETASRAKASIAPHAIAREMGSDWETPVAEVDVRVGGSDLEPVPAPDLALFRQGTARGSLERPSTERSRVGLRGQREFQVRLCAWIPCMPSGHRGR